MKLEIDLSQGKTHKIGIKNGKLTWEFDESEKAVAIKLEPTRGVSFPMGISVAKALLESSRDLTAKEIARLTGYTISGVFKALRAMEKKGQVISTGVEGRSITWALAPTNEPKHMMALGDSW